MKGISKGSWKAIRLLSTSAVLFVGYFFPISPIVGSYCSFFSVSDFIAPLAGLFGNVFVVIVALVRIVDFDRGLISFITPLYHLPGICGAIAWSRFTIFYRVIVPVACMIVFSVHPIGRFVIPYTFYWLIPSILYFFKRQSIFENALACTFVTHAVGSVVWLYFKNISVSVWWSLLPIVPFERLLSAVMMTAVYYAIQESVRFITMSSVIKKTKKLFYKNYN